MRWPLHLWQALTTLTSPAQHVGLHPDPVTCHGGISDKQRTRREAESTTHQWMMSSRALDRHDSPGTRGYAGRCN